MAGAGRHPRTIPLAAASGHCPTRNPLLKNNWRGTKAVRVFHPAAANCFCPSIAATSVYAVAATSRRPYLLLHIVPASPVGLLFLRSLPAQRYNTALHHIFYRAANRQSDHRPFGKSQSCRPPFRGWHPAGRAAASCRETRCCLLRLPACHSRKRGAPP